MKNELKFSSNANLNRRAAIFRAAVTLLVGLMLLTGCNVGRQHNVSGCQAFNAGQANTAINQFQQAINRNPQNAEAHYNLASTYYTLGKQQNNQQWIKQAEQLYRQSIALNDRSPESHRGLAALLIETGQEKFAFDLMNSWQARYPTSPEPVIELARLYQEYGDNRRATDLLADALRLDGTSVRALKAMGHIREVQGQPHLALDNYLRVLQLDNQQTDVASRVQTLYTQIAQLQNDPNSSGQPVQQPRYGSTSPFLPR